MRRTTKQRLQFELGTIRNELLSTVSKIDEADFQYAPVQGMKSYAKILHEIGWIEYEAMTLLTEGRTPSEEESFASIRVDRLENLLQDLGAQRRKLEDWLDTCTEAQLLEPIPLDAGWQMFFGTTTLEPEELVRWIARHEYYHLGQIIIYKWIQGQNPYEKSQTE